MRFGLLGPCEVSAGDRPVVIDRPRWRSVLAYLLLRANQLVPVETVIDAIWGGTPPATARTQVHAAVSAVRRALREAGAPDPIATHTAGYVVKVTEDELDIAEFTRHLSASREAATDRPDEAARILRVALDLWRGQALADITGAFVESARAQLDEQRLTAYERLADLELDLGHHADLVPELAPLVDANPLRERLIGRYMLALYRDGRQADALRAARQLRQHLADDQGLDPGRALTDLEHAILRADPTLDWSPPNTTPVAGTAVSAPRMSRRTPVPAQLPVDLPDFTGREDQLTRLDALLPDGAGSSGTILITTIAGTGGIGKTTLAVHWAHRVRHHFPDGQLYLNLHGYSTAPPVRPLDALARFLRALDVPARQIPGDADEAAAMYRSVLADKRLLIVLDNAASPDQVRPLLPGSPGCLALVTSRDRLTGLVVREGARTLPLDILTRAESVSLLGRTVGAGRVATEPEAADALAVLCGHLPLALRIAGAMLAAHPDRRIADYVAELSHDGRLAGLEVEGDPDASVRASLDLSYASLTPAVARLFRLLGLVPGVDITVDAAGALADVSPNAAPGLLDTLVAAHLVYRPEAGRYALHDLVRDYARDRVSTDEPALRREEATSRLLDWYTCVLHASSRLISPERTEVVSTLRYAHEELPFASNPRAASEFIDEERANLLPVARLAAARRDHAASYAIAYLTEGFFLSHGHGRDGLEINEIALASARNLDSARETRCHIRLAAAHALSRRYDRAHDHLRQAIALSQRDGDVRSEASINKNLALLFAEQRRYAEALEANQRALALYESMNDRVRVATVLSNMGEDHVDLGEPEMGVSCFEKALAIQQDLSDQAGQVRTLSALGMTRSRAGDHDVGLTYLQRSFALARQIGDRSLESTNLHCIGQVHLAAGGYQSAMDYLTRALTIRRTMGDRHLEAVTLNSLAEAHLGLGDLAKAREYLELALAARAEVPDAHEEELIRRNLEELGRHGEGGSGWAGQAAHRA